MKKKEIIKIILKAIQESLGGETFFFYNKEKGNYLQVFMDGTAIEITEEVHNKLMFYGDKIDQLQKKETNV